MSLIDFNETYKPFNYPWAIDITVEHEKIHWGEWEVNLNEDVAQWKGGKLTEIEMNHITQILRLFTQSDVAVGGNYYDWLLPKFKNNEIRNMLGSFANREGVHQRAYAILNDTLGFPDEEYKAFLEYQEMSDKIEFMQDNNSNSLSGLALTVAKSVLNEGVSLFAAFVMLLNYQRFGKMKGMCEVVEWSIRDESMHVIGNTKLFRVFCEEHPKIVTKELKDKIHNMANQVVSLEDKFIDLTYELGPVEGLSADEVKEYIRYITDRRLIQLGAGSVFNVRNNPLPWLDWVINGDSFKNFFEGTVTDYNAAGMTGDWGWETESEKTES